MNRSIFINSGEKREELKAFVEGLGTETVSLSAFAEGATTLGLLTSRESDKGKHQREVTAIRTALRDFSTPYMSEGRKGPKQNGQKGGYTPYGVSALAPVGTEVYAVPVNESGAYDKEGDLAMFAGDSLPEGLPSNQKKKHLLDTIGAGGGDGWNFDPSWLSRVQDFKGYGEVTGAEFLVMSSMAKGSGRGKPGSINGIKITLA